MNGPEAELPHARQERLVGEKGFRAVCVEADWPDAARVNRYVHGADDDLNAAASLADCERFPAWLWRNADVVEFVEWLRRHNDARGADAPRTGFHGLDLYNLQAAMSKRVAPLDQLLDSLEVTLELRDASVPRERSGAGMLELTCGASVRFSPEGVTIAPPRRSLRVVPNSTAIRIRVGCQGTLDLFEHLSEPCASTPSACSPSRSWPASPA